ncbi:glucose-1-phosphate cytidylyltransferase [Devosia nitrariae]|uniref:Glucose-1-phosphate cytidylyltransferase n=2 Tax=Devosia nitrariae TaxID=2071872 RepID=A0ABQ5WDP6_9HYPH|nr:glucose-1-phosphate cytidylyltransferase [Devosia nitrariae]
MKYYSSFGFDDFVILGGYKVEVIRSFFIGYRAEHSDFTINLGTGDVDWLGGARENWRVTVLNTGADAMTGGRLLAARAHLNETFCLTYGDGLGNVDLTALIAQHKAERPLCTLTAVSQPGRYGALRIGDAGTTVEAFREKGQGDGGLINGGFFVCEPEVLSLIDGPQTVWEEEPMDRMIAMGKLGSYHHQGYWQSMDSLRDKRVLDQVWSEGNAPWKTWQD